MSNTFDNADTIKCVVWDLDNTIWDGILLEESVVLRSHIAEVLSVLDGRGILHSIASRNDSTLALAKLTEFGLIDYFVYPQVNWSSKSHSLEEISRVLNVAVDSLAFVDDDPFERDEVLSRLPQVRTYDPSMGKDLLNLPEMSIFHATNESRSRRAMYKAEQARSVAESRYGGPTQEFMDSLGLVLQLSRAGYEHLARAAELLERTNQLNATGCIYSLVELEYFLTSEKHVLLAAFLEDRYGAYGQIGLILIECDPTKWVLKSLLFSCRVASRGIAHVVLNALRQIASDRGVRLFAEFVPTERNRGMYIAYCFAGFIPCDESPTLRFESGAGEIAPPPSHIKIVWSNSLDDFAHAR